MKSRSKVMYVCLCMIGAFCLAMGMTACGSKPNDSSVEGQISMEWQENYELGLRLLNDRNYAEAILAFQAAIQIDPKNADAYCELAKAYLYSGNVSGAQMALQDGMNHCDDVERIRTTASQLGFIVEEDGVISGLNWKGQYDLGIRLLNEGKYEEAILAFQAAITIDPKNVEAYVLLADAYNSNGNADGAMAALQDGLKQTGDTDRIKEYVDKFGFRMDENGNVYQLTPEEAMAEKLAALPVADQVKYYTSQAGQDWQGCFEDNILLFGQDARVISLEQLKNEALQRGWDSSWNLEVTRYSGVPYTYLTNGFGRGLIYGQRWDDAKGGVGLTLLKVGYEELWYSSRGQYQFQLAPGSEMGILNLQAGDSLETVLTKLGVSYAPQIAASALKWSATEEIDVIYDGGGIYKQFANSTDVPDGTKINESISVYYEKRSLADTSIQDSIQLEYRVYYKNTVSTTLKLFFFGPEYELWYYEVTNY